MSERKTPEQKLEILNARRAKLAARLAAIDSQIEKLKKAKTEAQLREMLVLIRRYNVTPAQLSQLIIERESKNAGA